MDLASVACAIQNLWLAARAENIGVGWVSLFEPEALRELLRMPPGSRPVAVLCLGGAGRWQERRCASDLLPHRRSVADSVAGDLQQGCEGRFKRRGKENSP